MNCSRPDLPSHAAVADTANDSSDSGCTRPPIDNRQRAVCGIIMSKNFKHKGRKRFHESDNRSGLRPDLVHMIQDILTVLDEAVRPQELNLPGYRLHPLKGTLNGYWAVTVRANWRIVFRFEGTNAVDVDLVDYH